jgi:hypothetical protein
MGGMAKGRRDTRQAWQELEGLLQQTLADVKQMDLTEVDIHFSTHKSTAWRQLFNVHKNVRQPEVSHLQKEAHEIVKDMGISLASYSLVLITSGADNATAWIQGLKGHESGPFMVAKVWETAVDEVREKYMVNPSKPNLLLIKFKLLQEPMTLRATLKKEGRAVDMSLEIKETLKKILLEGILCDDGSFLCPKEWQTAWRINSQGYFLHA